MSKRGEFDLKEARREDLGAYLRDMYRRQMDAEIVDAFGIPATFFNAPGDVNRQAAVVLGWMVEREMDRLRRDLERDLINVTFERLLRWDSVHVPMTWRRWFLKLRVVMGFVTLVWVLMVWGIVR